MKEKLSKILNYIYFRLAKVYYKWDGEEADTATHGLSTFFFGIMIDLMIFFRVGSFGVQMNSESNRAFIQNTLVHDVLGYPRFREVATPRTSLNNPFGLSLDFSIGGNTLWD